MATAGTVKTLTRKVEFTGGYADVIDDADNTTCGELSFAGGRAAPSSGSGAARRRPREEICTGET